MKKLLFAFSAVAMFVATGVQAAQKPIHVRETVEINAPVGKVWDLVKGYDTLPSWNPVFAKDEIKSGTNNKPGAVRELTIKDGPSFQEKLLVWNEKTHTYKYNIIEPNKLPIKGYVSQLTVKAKGEGKSEIVWVADYKRKNPAAKPPEGETDEAVTKLIQGVFRTGLDNVKKMAEGS